MAEVRAAARAVDFGAGDAPATVDRFFESALDGRVEARPPGSALELGLALEQRLPASRAGEYARPFLPEEGATSGPLRTVLAHDCILLRGEQRAPLGFRMRDGEMAF